jgi:hypothetical protein
VLKLRMHVPHAVLIVAAQQVAYAGNTALFNDSCSACL